MNGNVKAKVRIASAIVALLLFVIFVGAVGLGDKANLGSLYSMLVAAIIAALAATIIAKMFTGEIDLSLLVSEDNGSASLSRFQFLLFSFVIASCYFLLVVRSGTSTELPGIPNGVLGLIGISGGSYVIAKGIQKSAEAGSGSSVTAITLANAGSGYAATATVSLSGGGGGSGATARITGVNEAGAITGITVVSAGSGYTSAPTVSITDPNGTGAAAVATIG
jgi:hypothetical protein